MTAAARSVTRTCLPTVVGLGAGVGFVLTVVVVVASLLEAGEWLAPIADPASGFALVPARSEVGLLGALLPAALLLVGNLTGSLLGRTRPVHDRVRV